MGRAAVFWLLLALAGTAAAAQERGAPEGSLVAVGGQAGSFGGFTVRLPARTPRSVVATLVLGDETVLGSAARQFDTRLPESPLRLFVAPGVYGGREAGTGAAGVLMLMGVGFYAHRFDVYLQAVPGIRVYPREHPFVRAAAGLRYAL
ncbi:MAG TPA: hypothetical protein VD948_06920 [Rhodothermales bacterium]|nr:hypothetical protein [Rhodothermales bacterium]